MPWWPPREPFFDKLDDFLAHSNSSRRHLLVLADSGMGKTSLLLNYYATNQSRSAANRHRIALVYLGGGDADELIGAIDSQQDTVLFLDALDEDTSAVDDPAGRLLELAQISKSFRRVVVTCRTQFFPSEDAIPTTAGVMRIGPRRAGEPQELEFWKLFLSPLSDAQVEKYIRLRYPRPWSRQRRKAMAAVRQIPQLSVRPMLLAHLPDVMAQRNNTRTASDLYQAMIEAWLERERKWVAPRDLLAFSERLALNLFSGRVQRGGERMSRTEMLDFAELVDCRIEDWKLSGRSLLNRDGDGRIKFAHRSILEYLFVRLGLRSPHVVASLALSDQMTGFLSDELSLPDDSSGPTCVKPIRDLEVVRGTPEGPIFYVVGSAPTTISDPRPPVPENRLFPVPRRFVKGFPGPRFPRNLAEKVSHAFLPAGGNWSPRKPLEVYLLPGGAEVTSLLLFQEEAVRSRPVLLGLERDDSDPEILNRIESAAHLSGGLEVLDRRALATELARFGRLPPSILTRGVHYFVSGEALAICAFLMEAVFRQEMMEVEDVPHVLSFDRFDPSVAIIMKVRPSQSPKARAELSVPQ